MYYKILTKNGKFYNASPTIHAYSDGSNWQASVNEDGKLHSIIGPAYKDRYFQEFEFYFINGIQYVKEDWLNRDDVKSAIKMNGALE